MAQQIIFAIKADDLGRLAFATNMPRPIPGRGLTAEAAAALDLVRLVQQLPNLDKIEFDAAHLAPDADDAIALVRELINPDGYGYSVTPEVSNHARRVLHIKGKQVGLSE